MHVPLKKWCECVNKCVRMQNGNCNNERGGKVSVCVSAHLDESLQSNRYRCILFILHNGIKVS